MRQARRLHLWRRDLRKAGRSAKARRRTTARHVAVHTGQAISMHQREVITGVWRKVPLLHELFSLTLAKKSKIVFGERWLTEVLLRCDVVKG